MADSPRRCGFCREEIAPDAKVCCHCSRSQNRWINLLRSSDVIVSAISVAVLVVTIGQLNEAKDTNVKAHQALEKSHCDRSPSVRSPQRRFEGRRMRRSNC